MPDQGEASSFDSIFRKKKPPMAPFEFWEKTVEWVFVRKYFSPALLAAPMSGNAELAGDAVLNFLSKGRLCLIEFKRRELDFKSERDKYPIYGAAKWKELTVKQQQAYEDAFHALVETYGKRGDTPHLFVYGVLKEMTLLDVVNSASQRTGQALRELDLPGAAKALLGTLQGSDAQGRKTLGLDVEGKPYWGDWGNRDDLFTLDPHTESVQLSELYESGWVFDDFKAYVTSLVAAKGRKPGDDPGGLDWGHAMIMAVASDGGSLTFSVHEFVDKFIEAIKGEQEQEKEIGSTRLK